MTVLENTTADFAHYLTVEQGLAPNSVASYRQEVQTFAAYLQAQRLSDFARLTGSPS